MDTGQLLALQTQRTLQRRLDAAANNLANASTTGFKADATLFEAAIERPASASSPQRDTVSFVRDLGSYRDMSQGGLSRTGSAFDVAIEGAGFFAVQGPTGQTLYTRDGSFRLNATNQLVNRDGYPVLGAGGAPIAFDPQGQEPLIAKDGAILIAGGEAGTLQVSTFPDPSRLVKVGENLFEPGGQAPGPREGVVVQGALEDSNVKPVNELTRIMEISRAYESAARVARQHDELRQSAIQRLSR